MFPQLKQIALLNGSSVATNANTTATVDLQGFDWATIDVFGATAAATDQPTVLKIGEGDTTSAFTDITAFVGGTATATNVGYVIPAQITSTSVFYSVKFNIDCRARKRYLQVSIGSPGATTAFSAVANLGKGEQAPVNATKANVQALVEG